MIKLDPQGRVVWSTYLGGTSGAGSQTGYGVGVDLLSSSPKYWRSASKKSVQ